jgi:hypothetical protein
LKILLQIHEAAAIDLKLQWLEGSPGLTIG